MVPINFIYCKIVSLILNTAKTGRFVASFYFYQQLYSTQGKMCKVLVISFFWGARYREWENETAIFSITAAK
jgi:hypothetical protein